MNPTRFDRTIAPTLDGPLRQTLDAALEHLARAVSDRVPGLRRHVRVAALPSEEAVSPGARAWFEQHFMDRLDPLGFSTAQSAAPWHALNVSAFRPPDVPPRLR